MKKKLYIGCALTNLPADKRDALLEMISEIKKELSKTFEILVFKGVSDLGSSKPLSVKEIYDFDIKECVMKAECMLAIVDYPSLGLGYEIATAVEKMGIPVLAVAHKDSIVTRLIMGIDHKNFKFFNYNSAEEITKKTVESLTK
jgi:predicted metal-binding protein